MAEREPVSAENITFQYEGGTLLTADAARVIPWAEARTRLAEARFYWLATVHQDGRPHVRPVLAVWADGTLYSSTNPTTRKGQNLTQDSRFAITATTDGLDLIVEGEATRVSDEARLQGVADAYISKYGWPVTVRDGAFDAPYGAPTAGPPPYHVYELTPMVVFGLGTGETFAPQTTRWRFS